MRTYFIAALAALTAGKLMTGAPTPVITSFTTSASSVTAGQTVTLSWTASGATSIAITPGAAGTGTYSNSATPASGSAVFTPPSTASIVFDGDSLTCGVGTTNSNCHSLVPGGYSTCCTYPIFVTEALTNFGKAIAKSTNVSISGTTAEPGQLYSQPQPACSAATNQPSIVAEWLGTNDLAYDRTPQQLITDLQARWTLLVNAGCKVAAFTILNRTPGEGNAGHFSTAARNSANALIRSTAAMMGIPVVDVAADARIGCDACDMNSYYFVSDHTHLTDEGYRVVASLATPVLNSLLAVTYKIAANNTSGGPTVTVAVQSKPAPVLPDADADGVPDSSDNCVGIFNPDQIDSLSDGTGDPCRAPLPTVTVPSVTGLTQSAAAFALRNAGLIAGSVTTVASNTVAAGSVVSESPVSGATANAGSAVNLVLSSGAGLPAVPNVVSDTQALATTTIQAAGYVVGAVTFATSSTIASGSVISQTPAAGTQANPGSQVSFVISTGSLQFSFSVAGGGSGFTHTFSLSFTDPNGFASIQHVNILINNALDGRHACYLAFVPSGANGGSLFLVDDAGDAGGPFSGMVLPGASMVQNSQCSVLGSGASVAGSGNTLTLNLPVTFSAGFAGNQIIHLAAQDNGGTVSPWQSVATWNVPGTTVTGPSVSGMTPSQTSTLGQTYTFTFTDTNGWQDIQVADILLNGAIDGRAACYVAIVPSSATGASIYLVDDAGDAGGPYSGLVLPGAGTVQNSQCGIIGSGSSVSASGNTLTLSLAVTFNQSFAGNKVFYVAARNASQNSDWQATGTVTIP